MAAGRDHQALALAAAEEPLVLEQLHFGRRGHGDPARHRRAFRRTQRHDERAGDARFDRHSLLDRSEIALEDDRVLARCQLRDRHRRRTAGESVDAHACARRLGPHVQLTDGRRRFRHLEILGDLLAAGDRDRH